MKISFQIVIFLKFKVIKNNKGLINHKFKQISHKIILIRFKIIICLKTIIIFNRKTKISPKFKIVKHWAI